MTFRDEIGTTGVPAYSNAPGYVEDPPKTRCQTNQHETVLSCEGRRLADGSVVLDVLTTSPDAKTRKLATS